MSRIRTLLSSILAIALLCGCALPSFAKEVGTPLVVATDTLSSKFSPFYAESAYDRNVYLYTQVALLTTDRMGGIVYNAIEGETIPYNGKDYVYTGIADITVNFDKDANVTTYTAKLRRDVNFSDGVNITADDVIFNYYVYLDPSYVGATTLNSYAIVGLNDYVTQTTGDIYDKYAAIADAILANGEGFTDEQKEDFFALIKTAWEADIQGMINFCVSKYGAYAEETIGVSIDDIKASDSLPYAFGAALWGYAEYDAEADSITLPATEKTISLKDGTVTLEDIYNETFAAYNGDPDAYYSTEAVEASAPSVIANAKSAFIADYGPKDEASAGGIPNISGIKKLDDYTVEVKTVGYEAPAIYSLFGIEVAPMHYYGDPAQYNYDENQFGHPYGDLSIVQSKTTQPMGAGPYKFVKYENRVVYYEANENYFDGAPLIATLQLKETPSAEVAPGITTATVDVGEMNGSKTNFTAIAGYNSNGDITGDIITTSKVDNLGYGYIGINADTVNVEAVPDSQKSKDLRKALATVLSVCRDTAINSYYGEAAGVVNYPISNTSWAAPQVTDPDYKVAFSTDVSGSPIYAEGMTPDEKYAAALEAAKEYFIAAGYTFDDATGAFTAAPSGASLTYEIIIPGDGAGDHPSFAILTDAKELFNKLGITLSINDPADSNVMWDALNAGTQQMWCAAWQATIDPDMYQVYHSSGIIGKGGSDSNHYHIADTTLDDLIVSARTSDDQAFRKVEYKQALDVIMDWAVEIPIYQRQNCVIFSTERLSIDTLTPDITTYWGWNSEIYTLQMK